MVNRSRSVLVGLMIAACAMFALAANEPNPKPDALERGIQAYLSGNDAGAEQFLAEATRRDPHDPRPLYFRALCLRHQGRSREARADFILAASLEARSQGSYPVDESLARALAADRLKLQQYRWHVRSPFDATDATSLSSDTRRPATIDIRTDADSLRQPVSVPLDRLVQPVSLSELVKLATEVPAAEPPRIEQNCLKGDRPTSAVPAAPAIHLATTLERRRRARFQPGSCWAFSVARSPMPHRSRRSMEFGSSCPRSPRPLPTIQRRQPRLTSVPVQSRRPKRKIRSPSRPRRPRRQRTMNHQPRPPKRIRSVRRVAAGELYLIR